MKKLNELLIVIIFILTAVLAASVGFRAFDLYDRDKRLAREQEEMETAQLFARNQEAQDRVKEMEEEIQQLTEDREELQRFISRIQNEDLTGLAYDTVSENDRTEENRTVSGNVMVTGDYTVSGNVMVTGDYTVSGNDTVSGNNTVSGNHTVSGNYAVSGNSTVSDNGTVSENGTISGNDTVSDNTTVSGNNSPTGYMTLAERRMLRTSLEETWRVGREDRQTIAKSRMDFSGMKIACLGDSITAAENLVNEENYQQYSYPARLKQLLGAGEVYNLGIGGSSIGRYWADSFVDRYRDIPSDTDIIIVMGGTNDGFCVSDKEFGSLSERGYRTFCGDLDELMKGLHENYPDADIFFVTPLPNILHDYLMSERDYLLPQHKFADVILALAQEYDYGIIDLYNSNILDSHDADIVASYVPDGVHANHEGYQIIAEHIAAELIRYYENKNTGGE